MGDITLISVFGFFSIKLVLWIPVVLYGISIVCKLYKDSQSQESYQSSDLELPRLLYEHRWKLIRWVGLLLVVVLYTANESAYRPKTVINPPNPVLKEQLRAIDNAPVPDVKPGSSLAPEVDNSSNSFEENRRSNKSAREEFMKLPDASEDTK